MGDFFFKIFFFKVNGGNGYSDVIRGGGGGFGGRIVFYYCGGFFDGVFEVVGGNGYVENGVVGIVYVEMVGNDFSCVYCILKVDNKGWLFLIEWIN